MVKSVDIDARETCPRTAPLEPPWDGQAVASRSLAFRSPTVRPVGRLTSNSGLLACIESLALDRNVPASQAGLIRRYPVKCRRGQSDEGCLALWDALEIVADLELSSSSEILVSTADFAELGLRIDAGVFLCVPRAAGTSLWWRLAAVDPDGVRVMQPESDDPARLGSCTWAEIDRQGIWALSFDR